LRFPCSLLFDSPFHWTKYSRLDGEPR
jgi:hypothetical protein